MERNKFCFPGYDTTQKATDQINIKEVRDMDKSQIIKYYLDNIDALFYADTADWFEPLAEFIGTGICDGYCHKDSSDCVDYCSLFHAMSTLKTEPTIESLNEVKSIVCQMINSNIGGE